MRAALLASLLATSSCSELPEIAAGVCGNYVVDPGEDCDTFAASSASVCAPPGATHACRYVCEANADGARPACPGGMGCGLDGVCRAARGTFARTAEVASSDARALLVADVDGDRRDELVGVMGPSRAVLALEGGGLVTRDESPIAARGSPAPARGDLSGDGRDDLLVPSQLGVVVELGTPQTTLSPTAYPSLVAPAELAALHLIGADVLPSAAGDEALFLATLGGGSGLAYADALTGQLSVLTLLPGGPDALAGPVQVGRFAEDVALAPCEQLALGFRDATSVLLVQPCKVAGDGTVGWAVGAAARAVTFAGGSKLASGPIAYDVDADGHLDLVAGLDSCAGCPGVFVAYGGGDGTFHSDPSALPPADGDDAFCPTALVEGPLPLALGDLDGDGLVDFVRPDGVYHGHGDPPQWTSVAKSAPAGWSEAVVADLNGNGLADVIAASAKTSGLVFLNGTGDGHLNAFDVPTQAPVHALVVGDFDGDVLGDVAFAEAGEAESGPDDAIAVSFGRPFGAPESPRALGRLGSVRQLLGAFGHTPDGVADGIADLVSASKDDDGRIELGSFLGRSDRSLRSPFTTSRIVGAQPVLYYPERLVLGRFSGAGTTDVATVGLRFDAEPQGGERRLWLVPSLGDARFDLGATRPSEPLPAGIDWGRALVAPLDLDGDGRDELVLLAPTEGDAPVGRGAVAHLETADGGGEAWAWTLGPLQSLGHVFARVEAATAAPVPNGACRAADLDSDGRVDLVASSAADLVVFWNDGGAWPSQAVVPIAGDAPIADFALLEAGGGGRTEIAIAVGSRVVLARFETGRSVVVDALASVDVGAEIRLIEAGDFDGDGVDDLAVATASSIELWRGEAVSP